MSYKIIEVKTNSQLNEFIKLPYEIYKGDKNFVAPLNFMIKKTLKGKDNPLFDNGPHKMFLLKDDKKCIGRILTGFDEKINKEKGFKTGYISLFECIDDKKAAFMLFDTCKTWLQKNKMTDMMGPMSPTNGDDYKGLLVEGFEHMPSLLCSYNPKYYIKFFEEYGFKNGKDHYAFLFLPEAFPLDRFKRVVNYAMKKYDFRIDKANKRKIDRDLKDIHTVLLKALPDSWEHLIVPSPEEIKKEANALLPFIDEDFIFIARSNKDDSPIGFVVGCPNFNEVLQKMNGNVFPTGIFKFLYYRNKMESLRLFIQFVVPEYQGRAVNIAIFYNYLKNAKDKGYKWAEGGTIGEENWQALKAMEATGGKRYKTYRLYTLDI